MSAGRPEEQALDDLRRRLYAPGATPADLERFEAARPADAPDPPPPPRWSTRRRRALVGGVLAVAVVAAVLLARQPEAPEAPTTTAAAPAGEEPLLASQTVRSGFVRALDSSSSAGILPYLEAHPDARPDALRTLQRAASTEYAGEGTTTVDLAPSALAEQGGRITVIVVTDAATAYEWRATAEDAAGTAAPVATHRGAASAGGPVSSTSAYRRPAPAALTLRVPDHVRWGLAVTFSD